MKKIFFVCIFFICCVTALKADVKVYPNPWIPESGVSQSSTGDTKKHGSLYADGWIKFKGVQTETGTLTIYDVVGNLIKTINWKVPENIPLPSTTTETGDIVHWDGRNNNYEYVESGVYIWIIKEDNGKKYNGKVVVIR